jgi:hypothetical protein
MPALSVIIAPHGPADGVLDALQDLSALHRVSDFLWVCAEQVDGREVPALEVRDGDRRGTSVQEALIAHRHDRIRVCVLVPLVADAACVPSRVEQAVAEMVSDSAGGARVERLRVALVRPDAGRDKGDLAREGWHNLLLAPEESAGPGYPHHLLPASSDPIEIGRHAAPAIAGILGLWTGLEQGPLDDDAVLPGHTVRQVRSFYRQLDASAVERELRDRVSSVRDAMPIPREHGEVAVYVEDVQLATSAMAKALWTKHAAVLHSPRVRPTVGEVRPIGPWAAVKMLFGFLGAALRNAPATWYATVMNSAASSAASSVQSVVFGGAPAAYEVVVKNMTASGVPASWTDLADASRQLDDAFVARGEAREHESPVRLGGLWRDYAMAALTLADGGQRDPALPPVHVGASRGVVRDGKDCVPGREHAFTELSGYIAATVGVDRVEPVDVLGAHTLRRRLDHLAEDPVAALDADRARQTLQRWQTDRSRSFGVQVGSVLGRRVIEVADEIRQLLQSIAALAAAGQPDAASQARQRKLARWLRFLLIAAGVILVALVVLGALGVIGWSLVGAVAAGTVLAWFGTSVGLFMTRQRELFRELNRRRAAVTQMEANRTNLRSALRDQRHLSAAYQQFLVWSAVLGTFLEQPFGFAHAGDAGVWGGLVDGLPISARIGAAVVEPAQVAEVAALARRDVFATGWLSGPFETLVREAPTRIGPDAQDLRDDPAGLFALPAGPADSLLVRWQSSLATDGVGTTSGDVLWGHVLDQLNGRDQGQQLRDRLVTGVRPSDGSSSVPCADFMAGVDETDVPRGRQRFDAAVLTSDARVSGRDAVDSTWGATVHDGLGRVAVLVQLGEGLPVYDFAVASSESPDDAMAAEAPARQPDDRERRMPEGQGWVF